MAAPSTDTNGSIPPEAGATPAGIAPAATPKLEEMVKTIFDALPEIGKAVDELGNKISTMEKRQTDQQKQLEDLDRNIDAKLEERVIPKVQAVLEKSFPKTESAPEYVPPAATQAMGLQPTGLFAAIQRYAFDPGSPFAGIIAKYLGGSQDQGNLITINLNDIFGTSLAKVVREQAIAGIRSQFNLPELPPHITTIGEHL